jgi:methyl-accepting chemotaxis protein
MTHPRKNPAMQKHTHIGIFPRLVLSYLLVVIGVSAIFSLMAYNFFRQQMQSKIREGLQNLATVAALQLDGDAHATLQTPDDQATPAYQQAWTDLNTILTQAQGLTYAYTMRQNAAGEIIYIIDSSEEPDPIGSVAAEPGPTLAANFATLDHPLLEDDFYTDEWGVWLTAYAPFYRSDGQREGILGLDISVAEIAAQERQLLGFCLALSLALIVLGTLLGWVMSRQLVGPLLTLIGVVNQVADEELPALQGAATALAAGDLNAEVKFSLPPLATHYPGELNDLAQALNRVLQGLQASGTAVSQIASNFRDGIGDAAETIAGLETASGRLVGIAGDSSQAVAQIALTISQVAAGIGQQAASGGRVSAAAEEMGRAVVQVSDGIHAQGEVVAQAAATAARLSTEIQDVAQRADQQVQTAAASQANSQASRQVVEDTIQGMSRIKDKVDFTAVKIAEMGVESAKIGQIVDTITDLASQTNLLALNAAIEAARAGEQGRGFAVVAGEVRKLAEKSAAATKEISGLIAAIQARMDEAVASMRASTNEVEQEMGLANQAGAALTDILAVVAASRASGETIAAAAAQMGGRAAQLAQYMAQVSEAMAANTRATETMAVNSSEVVQAMENSASMAQESSAAVEEVAASAQEMRTQAEEVDEAARFLTQLAGVLAHWLDRFQADAAPRPTPAALLTPSGRSGQQLVAPLEKPANFSHN